MTNYLHIMTLETHVDDAVGKLCVLILHIFDFRHTSHPILLNSYPLLTHFIKLSWQSHLLPQSRIIYMPTLSRRKWFKLETVCCGNRYNGFGIDLKILDFLMILTAGCTYDSWLHRCHPCSRGLHHTSTFCEYTLLSGTASHWMNTWLVALGDGHNESATHLIGPAGDKSDVSERSPEKVQ